MKIATSIRVIGLFIGFSFLLQLIGCTGPLPNTYNHQFRFEANKSAQILDYQYGDGKELNTRPNSYDKEIVKKLNRDYFGGTAAQMYMSKPNSLYVKWRDVQSEKVFEVTVDFRGKLPEDMTNWTVYFEAHAENLYVYLFPPKKMTTNTGEVYYVNGREQFMGHTETQDIPYNKEHMIFHTDN